MPVEAKLFPLGDGGEGTSAIAASYVGARPVEVLVNDPLFRRRKAVYWITPDGHTAYIEMAAAAGLPGLAMEERNPLQTTTYGVGEMLADAIEKGVQKVVLCVGGSATHDVGLGMAEALGYVFLDSGGQPVRPVGENLARIIYMDSEGLNPGLKDLEVEVWCDVHTALYGEKGAARVYGPQKGANEHMVALLEEGTRHISLVMEEFSGVKLEGMLYAGAGGGLAGGARVFLNATLKSGIASLMALGGFEAWISWADIVITGEGRLDEQTMEGKVLSGVLSKAGEQRKPVVALCGSVGKGVAQMGLLAAFSVVSGPCTWEESVAHTAQLLEETACNVSRLALYFG